MESQSPCAKIECIHKNKIKCCETCLELFEYQEYLATMEDHFSPPGIDYTDEHRMSINPNRKKNEAKEE